MIRKLILLLVLSSPCWGAWSLVQKKLAFSTLGVNSESASFTSTPTVGNTIIVGFERGSSMSNGLPLVTDNQASGGNAYALLNYLPNNNFAIGAAAFCATANASSGTFTVSATLAATLTDFMNVYILEYSGGSCNPDKVSSATGSTSPYGCGSITTLNANDLLFTVLNNNGAGTLTFTAPSGFTKQLEQTNGSDQGGAIADQIVSSTGTFAPTWVVSANAASNCVLVALMQASGGGGGGGTISAVFP